jgi:transposase
MNLISPQKLLLLSKKEKNATKRIRLLAVSQFLECQNRTQVANQLKVSRRSVNNWVSNYLSFGLTGIEDKPRYGRQSFINDTQKAQLSAYIKEKSDSCKGGRLIGEDIRRYIIDEFHVNYHLNHIYHLVKKLGFSWITSRSKHLKQSQEAQDEFKKTAD